MQQRGLAATGRSDNANEFAGTHLKIDAVESEQTLAALRAVAEADVAQADFLWRRRKIVGIEQYRGWRGNSPLLAKTARNGALAVPRDACDSECCAR